LAVFKGDIDFFVDRYWGFSSPYEVLTTDNLRYLTLNQSIADLTHFASTVKLPFDPHKTSVAAKAVCSSSVKQIKVNHLTDKHNSHGSCTEAHTQVH